MTTTQDAVHRDLVSRVQSFFSGLSSSYVYISATVQHVPVTASQYIQIVPGSGSVPNAGTGLNRIVENVTVAMFFESRLDQHGHDTTKLTKDAESLFEMRNTLRGDAGRTDPDNPTGLILHTLGGSLVEPIQLTAFSEAQRWFDDPAWVVATDTYRVVYELTGAV